MLIGKKLGKPHRWSGFQWNKQNLPIIADRNLRNEHSAYGMELVPSPNEEVRNGFEIYVIPLLYVDFKDRKVKLGHGVADK